MDKYIIKGIIAQIEKELENISELKREMKEIKEIKQEDSIILRRSKGSILHDFYNCCERIFKNIAHEINGGYEEADKWHKALLFRMTIPIKGVRPPVISEKLAANLDEYLSFRHLFRNIYGFELKGDRLDRLVAKFDRVVDSFIREINAFLAILKKEST